MIVQPLRRLGIITLSVMSLGVGSVFAQTPIPVTVPTVPMENIPVFVPEVIHEIPHGTDEYTQGLVWHEGALYQSAGQYGESRLMELDPITGETLREVNLPQQFFAEGLALVDNRLIQITWREGYAFFYNVETFDLLGAYFYTGDGWGLCYDETREVIWMSDGSNYVFQRDPITFEVVETLPVTLNDQPLAALNELECVGNEIYANVYQTNQIVTIDMDSGAVTSVIDATGLLTPEQQAQLQPTSQVLNGIAYMPETDTFLITGKDWMSMFEVTFVPAG